MGSRSISRNHNDIDEASSSRKRSMTYARWSDLDHDLLCLVMMKLGFGDYFSFRGVCKAWRLLACSNKTKLISSLPPMSTIIFRPGFNKICQLHDFEGRKSKTILPSFCDGECVGLTCGYFIFFGGRASTYDFWLVNPITRKQLHFPNFPTDLYPDSRAILVFSQAISAMVFVVLCGGEIWFSIEGKGAWKHVPYTFRIIDLYAFKGKLYTLSYNNNTIDHRVVNERGDLCEVGQLCELRLEPEPKFTLLETRNSLSFEFLGPSTFVSSGEKLYVMDWSVKSFSLYELDFGEMKWVKPCDKTIEEYAFFFSCTKRVAVAVKRESWGDPRSRGKYAASHDNGRIIFYTEKMWYFLHQCMNVDRIDE